MTPAVGSLFAGMGGFDLAFDRAGFRTAWQVECDKHARRVLGKHWPGVPRDRCVAGFSRVPHRFCDSWLTRREAPDVVVGGFPCQDLSVAGKRAGLAGGRSGMWWQMLRIINGLRPRVVVFENVPGLFSSDRGRDFARVVGSLGERGYFGAWRVLDAQHFGVPQRRRRVFGCFARVGAGNPRRLPGATPREDGRRLAGLCAQVLALGEGCGGHPETGGAAGQDVARTVTPGLRRASGNDGSTAGGVVAFHATQDPITGEVSPCLGTGSSSGAASIGVYQTQGSNCGEMGTLRAGNGHTTGGVPFLVQGYAELGEGHATYQETEQAASLRTSTGGGGQMANVVFQAGGDFAGYQRTVASATVRSSPGGKDASLVVPIQDCRMGNKEQNGLGVAEPGDPAYTVDTTGGQGVMAFAQNQRDEVRDLGDLAGALAAEPGMKQQTYVAHTLRADGRDASEDGTGRGTPPVPGGVGSARRLTPTECLRLQGFPDDWLDDLRLADSVKYRLCGNAVCVNVVEWIARRLYALWPAFLEENP